NRPEPLQHESRARIWTELRARLVLLLEPGCRNESVLGVDGRIWIFVRIGTGDDVDASIGHPLNPAPRRELENFCRLGDVGKPRIAVAATGYRIAPRRAAVEAEEIVVVAAAEVERRRITQPEESGDVHRIDRLEAERALPRLSPVVTPIH